MHLLCALSFLFAWLVPDEADISVRHVTASSVVAKLRRGLMPEGMEAVADDLKNVIRVRGTESQILEVKHLVTLLDVASRRIDHRFRVSSPGDKLEYEGSVQLPNNLEFTFSHNTS